MTLAELRRLHPDLPDGDLRAIAAGEAVVHDGPVARHGRLPADVSIDEVDPEPGESLVAAAWRLHWARKPIHTPEQRALSDARMEVIRGLRALLGDEPPAAKRSSSPPDALALELRDETREAFGWLLGSE